MHEGLISTFKSGFLFQISKKNKKVVNVNDIKIHHFSGLRFFQSLLQVGQPVQVITKKLP